MDAYRIYVSLFNGMFSCSIRDDPILSTMKRHGRPDRRPTGRIGKVTHQTAHRSPRAPHPRSAPHIRCPPLQARQGPLPGPPFPRPPAGLVAASLKPRRADRPGPAVRRRCSGLWPPGATATASPAIAR